MLEAIGVTREQEQVFRALLGAPRRTAGQIAAATGLDEHCVAVAAKDLEAMGFLTRTPDQPPRLVPVRPDTAVEALVSQRKLELDRVSAAARELVREMEVQDRHRPDSLLEVVVGRAAISSRFAQLLSDTSTTLLVLDRPPYAASPDASDQKVRSMLQEGVTVRGIYSPDSLDLPGAVDEAMSAQDAGETSRVHPQVPMKLAIFDGHTALLPLSVDRLVDSALVVHESSVLNALLEMFELLWSDAVPILADSSDDVDERLLTLLSAGLKDEAIARQLRVSPRTVGRRIAELMEGLGARTRFQAGLFAQRRHYPG
jgi:DNA-binding NarL/FixJ family response regulator/DNA-binding MarR family transcriptional regulator